MTGWELHSNTKKKQTVHAANTKVKSVLSRFWQFVIFYFSLIIYSPKSVADHIPFCFWVFAVCSVVPVVWLLLWVSRDHRPPVQTGPVVHNLERRHYGPRAVLLSGDPCTHTGLWPHVRLISNGVFLLYVCVLVCGFPSLLCAYKFYNSATRKLTCH